MVELEDEMARWPAAVEHYADVIAVMLVGGLHDHLIPADHC